MARAVYSHEMGDPDFEWLIATYRERFPRGIEVSQPGMPFAIVSLEGVDTPSPLQAMLAPPPSSIAVPPGGEDKDSF